MRELINFVAFIYVGLIIIFLSKLTIAILKGKRGEIHVSFILSLLPKNKYRVINDIMLRVNDEFVQIDHIVISEYGIFVIETKNYKGGVKGTDEGYLWTQYLGKRKASFYNPFMQNNNHVEQLSNQLNLPRDYFISIVTFSNKCRIYGKYYNIIVNFNELNEEIRKYQDPIISESKTSIKRMIKKINCKSRKNKKIHHKNLNSHRKKGPAKVSRCPKCGALLVSRTGKYGPFKGCSNYPKCKYTQNV